MINIKSDLFKDATDDDNFDACVTKNSKNLGQCILTCNDDASCEETCVTTFKEKHSKCPCQVFQNHFFSQFFYTQLFQE